MSTEFNNLREVEERDGITIYEVDEKPTYTRRVSTKILLEQKANLQKELVMVDVRALDEKAKIQRTIDEIDAVLGMIEEKELEETKV